MFYSREMRIAKFLAQFLHRGSLSLLLLALGCTFQNLAVKQLDTLVSYQTGQRLALYTQQKKALDLDVKSFLLEEKGHVPRARALLQELPPPRTEALTQLWQRAMDLYLAVARDYTRLLCRYLVQLDASQREIFFRKLAEENAELKKKKESSLPERLEFFLGPLSKDQRKILENDSGASRKRHRERLRRRVGLQAELKIQLERTFPTQEERTQELSKTLPALFEASQQAQVEDTSVRDLLGALLPTLTPAQLQHLREKRQEALGLLELFLETSY